MKKAKPMPPSNMSIQPGSSQPDMKQSDHSEHNMPPTSRFESTMTVGDYAMPRAGKASDYFTDADKKANPSIK